MILITFGVTRYIIETADCEVHSDCPRDIRNSLNRSKGEAASLKKRARVIMGPFQTDCLFCSASGSSECSCVKTDTFAETILQCCAERSDDWGFVLKGRIGYHGYDLHAADCVYHYSCDGSFGSGLDIKQSLKGFAKHTCRDTLFK